MNSRVVSPPGRGGARRAVAALGRPRSRSRLLAAGRDLGDLLLVVGRRRWPRGPASPRRARRPSGRTRRPASRRRRGSGRGRRSSRLSCSAARVSSSRRARRSATVGTFSIVIFCLVTRSMVLSMPVLARLGQRDRHALAPGAADAADAVHVGLGRRRDVVVDDVGELVDVEAAGGDVGGDQQLGGAARAAGPSPGRAAPGSCRRAAPRRGSRGRSASR